MIILEEDNVSPGERSPLKSAASNPNTIRSPAIPVVRTPEDYSVPPPPPYGSTSTSTAAAPLVPVRTYGVTQKLKMQFSPEPYTRRSLRRFLHALFVAFLTLSVLSMINMSFVISDKNKNKISRPNYPSLPDRGWKNWDVTQDQNEKWTMEGNPEEIMTELSKIISSRGAPKSTDRRLPIQYPPTRLRCMEEGPPSPSPVVTELHIES